MAEPQQQEDPPQGQGQPPPEQAPPGAGQGPQIAIQPAGLQPGQQPTPEQIRQMQQQLATEAQKAGLTVPQFVERLKQQAMQQHQAQQMAQRQQQPQAQGQQGAQPGQQIPIQPGPPKPEAIAVAKFLQGQDLKQRTCILQEKRKGMFKVKRAIRALQSDAYTKARRKNPILPEVKDRVTAENTFKLLPLSLLALRVSKIDPHEGHNHGKKKRVKGQWDVKIEQQQEASDDYHYVWLYEGAQWKNKLRAFGALLAIFAVVLFPLWPLRLRLGVWYLSMACLGALGLFFAMAIFRLIFFLITMFAKPPGLWIFPNLFEDVGFIDSFKPGWAWHEDEKTMKKRKKEERIRKKERREAKSQAKAGGGKAGEKTQTEAKAEPTLIEPLAERTTTQVETDGAPQDSSASVQQRNLSARVEEVEDE